VAVQNFDSIRRNHVVSTVLQDDRSRVRKTPRRSRHAIRTVGTKGGGVLGVKKVDGSAEKSLAGRRRKLVTEDIRVTEVWVSL